MKKRILESFTAFDTEEGTDFANFVSFIDQMIGAKQIGMIRNGTAPMHMG